MSRAVLGSVALRGALAVILPLVPLPLSANSTVVDTGRAQCCTSINPQLPPATYYGATMYRDDDPRSVGDPAVNLPTDPPASVTELLKVVDQIEGESGPMSIDLAQPLQALGAAYVAGKDYRSAIRSLRRGIHLTRINGGLDSIAQTDMLEQLIAVHLQQRDFVAADEQQRYLFRVRSRQKNQDHLSRVEATKHYADWVRGAYLADLGKERFPRLVLLNDLYDDAIGDIEANVGEDSLDLLPYLKGRVELSYLISVYPGEQEATIRAGTMPTSEARVSKDGQVRFWRLQKHNFRYGLNALERSRDILEANAASSPRDIAEATIAIADWHQWHRRYAQAIRIYKEAWQLVAEAESEASRQWLAEKLSSPLELPQTTTFFPGPVPLQTSRDGEISITFDVSRHGEAKNISFLTPRTEDTRGAISRGYHYLRNVRFRPRMLDGKVVRTENLQRTYKVRY